MRERARQLCQEFLQGAWKDITPEDLVFKPITGGLTNILYYCGLPKSHKPRSKEPTEALLRIYGRAQDDEGADAILTDSVIFTILSERGLGPRLYGTFPGGRLEEFIPSRPIKVTEMAEEQYVQKITKKMANIHSLDIPKSKTPTFLKTTMEKWLKTSKDIISSGKIKCEDVDKFALEKVKNFNYEKEVNFVLDLITKRSSDVVFSHNDFQVGNILINQTNNNNNNANEITIIDFEYCSYNYRAYDLANHLCEYRYDYTSPEHPYFTRTKWQYPSKEQELSYVRSYMNSLKNAKSLNLNEEKFLKDIQVFKLAASLFWSLWSFVQSQSSTISFGYMQYAHEKIIDYNADKVKLDI